jgi:hypothetical protein
LEVFLIIFIGEYIYNQKFKKAAQGRIKNPEMSRSLSFKTWNFITSDLMIGVSLQILNISTTSTLGGLSTLLATVTLATIAIYAAKLFISLKFSNKNFLDLDSRIFDGMLAPSSV